MYACTGENLYATLVRVCRAHLNKVPAAADGGPQFIIYNARQMPHLGCDSSDGGRHRPISPPDGRQMPEPAHRPSSSSIGSQMPLRPISSSDRH